ERKKTLKTYENNQKLYAKQTQFLGTKILFLIIIIFSIAGLIFSLYGLGQYMYLSLYSLILEYTYHTFITSLFISDVDYIGFFLLIFMLMLLYFMARNIEARKGSKFLIKLYIISCLTSTLFYFILRLSLHFYIPIDLYSVPVGFAWGGILGLLSYSLFPIMNQQITAMMYFLPIKLKGRTFLYIIILFRLLPGLLLAFSSPVYLLFYLPDLGGILGAYIVYRAQLGR
ncbi:MAG: hypothetical protein KAX18_13460, partial [Candidatus Lokiarchaeota archaeon]|nr:hypothetical protein [Candidatus Lokiarchaeota archaeon]